MEKGQEAVVWFNEVTKQDIPLVGGKGANLGEMTNAGIPVPQGFIVTAAAYFDFIEKSGIHNKIKSLLDPVDVHNRGPGWRKNPDTRRLAKQEGERREPSQDHHTGREREACKFHPIETHRDSFR